MKITAIKTSVCNAEMRDWVFVRVETDQPGLYGWGEATLCGRAYNGSVERTVMCAIPNSSGMPYGGRIFWRADPEDWTECSVCAGTGLSTDKACQRCHGGGWLMGRQ
jgi:L-alanine-DL-glutamate epimerase-like enolase superfamily enzyme